MKCSTNTIKRCLTELIDQEFIIRELVYNNDLKTVKERRLYLNVHAGAKPKIGLSPEPIDEQYINTSY